MFEEKARGGGRELADMQGTREVEALVFQMASTVAQLKRLVDGLGTTKDTVEHRHKLTQQNAAVQSLAKDVKDRLSALTAERASMTEPQQAKTRKLTQDFAAMLQDYKATQKLAAEREASSLPRVAPPALPATASLDSGRDEEIERQSLLQAQQQAQRQQLGTAIEFNEALIEERDHSIQEITRQIGEVNEMFQDLAVLINDQGAQLNTIDVQISSTAERTREGTRELVKAERSQRAARNKCLMLWIVSGVVLAVILVIVFA